MAITPCPICCEDTPVHKFVECPKCNHEVCHRCVIGFVKTLSGDVNCMNCRQPWDRAFIFRTLPPSLVHGDLKQQRAEALLEREKAMLPATSQLVPLVTQENELREKIKEKKKALQALKEELKHLDIDMAAVRHDRYRLQYNLAPAGAENEGMLPASSRQPRAQPVNRIVCPCPTNDCRGYIFSDHKCSICSITICKECHAKTDEETEHTCKPDDVASVKLIKAECKPCPNCAAPSRKTEGCSQVWCLMCHVAWDWNTQKIETGEIHATDYFNYMRRNGGQLPRRGDGFIPGGARCGNRVNPAVILPRLHTKFENVMTQEELQFVRDRYQIVCEFRARENREIHPMATTDLRIKYLKGEIDESKWKQLLHKRDKDVTFKTEIHRMRAAYNHAMTDCIQEVCAASTEDELKNALETIHTFHDLMEDEYAKLSKCYNSKRKSPFVRTAEEPDNVGPQLY